MDMGAFCCGVTLVLPVYLMIGAALVIGGCSLYNRFAGRDSYERVPPPGLGRAAGIVLVNLIAGVPLAFGVGVLIAVGTGPLDHETRDVIVQLHAFPTAVILSGAVFAVMLPTTFARGLLAALCTVLVVVMIVAVLMLVFGALGLMIFLAK